MDAARALLHFDTDEQWLAKRKSREWKLGNLAMLQFSRRVPEEHQDRRGLDIETYAAWSRLINPLNTEPASEWYFSKRPRFSDAELRAT